MGTPNKNKVRIGNLVLYFSYETIVAYEYPSQGTQVCENVWSKTTGKLLNELEPDKSKRISHPIFETNLGEVMRVCNLTI